MTISKRLLLTLSIALLALLFVGIGGIWQMNESEKRLEYFNDNTLGSVHDLNTVAESVAAMRIELYRHGLSDDAKGMAEVEQQFDEASKRFDRMIDKYERDDISTRRTAHCLRPIAPRSNTIATRSRPSSSAPGPATMPRRADADGRRAVQGLLALRKAVAEHLEYNTKQGGIAVANNKAQHARSVSISERDRHYRRPYGHHGADAVRRIRGSLAQIQGSLEYVSRTLDLDHRAAVDRLDEIGLTAQSFNTLIERVAGTLRDVRRSTDSVGVAAAQIAAGNTDLSSRTEQQAASLEETASSMEQLTTTVRQNADNARRHRRWPATPRRWPIKATRRSTRWWRRWARSAPARAHRRDHEHDRGHRVPDQHPRAQCRRGSGTRRRTGPRLRRGGGRSAQPGATLVQRGQGNQGTDRSLGETVRAGSEQAQAWAAR
jgi:methyl-accepting chemotaxis protein